MQTMRKFMLIMLMMTCIALSSFLKANELKQSLNSDVTLPSTQTQTQLDKLSPGKIETRQAPDEEGIAQKETPISGVSISVISLMLTVSLAYIYIKKTNRQNMQK